MVSANVFIKVGILSILAVAAEEIEQCVDSPGGTYEKCTVNDEAQAESSLVRALLQTRQSRQDSLATKTQVVENPTAAELVEMPPMPCRDDFAALAEKLYNKSGNAVAVEIGVFQGDFAEKNLKQWSGQYFMVDAWAFRPSDPGDKNFADDSQNDENMKKAETRTEFAADRRHLVKALSTDAAAQFEDASIDWIYLDALHTKEAVLQDLAAWYPKLRPGGLLSGDDYGGAKDTEFVPSQRWVKSFGGVAMSPDNNWGVMSALHEFAPNHRLDIHVTWMHDCYGYPAWYARKPLDDIRNPQIA